MIVLQCGDKIRHVNDLYITPLKGQSCTYALVNNGHDDLFDLGFTVEELSKNNLYIRFEENKNI